MTTETEYQNAVNYLTKLLNGGLMGERGSKPLRIAIEACELQISKQPMQKLWGRKINDIAFGEFVQILEWAASNCGTEIVKIDRFAPSSKCCSRCGYIYTKLTLKQREWDCPSCGTHHERDVNAAINICRMGLVQMGYPA